MYPHRIRLRGPWEYQDPSGHRQRVDLPAGWQEFINDIHLPSVCIGRRFGTPRVLDPDESVFLTCRNARHGGMILNGHSVSPDYSVDGLAEFRITTFLQARNAVLLTLEKAVAAPDVALEVRGPVFLRGIKQTTEGWTGYVVGDARQNLELHLMRAGRLVQQMPVQANAEFALVLEPRQRLDASPHDLWSLELVEGGNRWYSVDV